MDATDDVIPGHTLGPRIAKGGMGEIFKARQHAPSRDVAVKLIAPEFSRDEVFRTRFRDEADAGAAVDHPAILPVYMTGETSDGRLYTTMRLIDGGQDLHALLEEHGPLTLEATVTILAPVAAALDAAHAKRIVHRDVKPKNVLLGPAAGSDVTSREVYLTDFGIARTIDNPGNLTVDGAGVGTPPYMAPEQARGEKDLDGRADVYAFGCTLFQCLTGQRPYERPTVAAVLLAHAQDPIPQPTALVPTLPAVVDDVVRRALAKEASDRATSASELLTMLGNARTATVADPFKDTEVQEVVDIAPPADLVPEAPRVSFKRPFQIQLVIFAVIFAATYIFGASL